MGSRGLPVHSMSAREAMLRDQDIICLSSIDWDFIWQGHQEIMSSLAQQGNRVLFIENTGVRTPNFHDLPRLRRRLWNWWHATKGFRQERENLYIYSPLIFPFPYSRLACWMNRALLLRALQRWMRTVGFRHSIVWTFLPTPLARDLIRALEPELTVYYCIDDFLSSSPGARRIRRSESQVFREANLVFVTSEKLQQRAAQFNERVYLFPFGVDFERFAKTRTDARQLPRELQHLPRPVVGYVGGVHQWVNQDLMEQVVSGFQEASFVFVGPWQTDVSRLARHPNVHLLGARPHEEVPAYIKGFDVGMVPYHLSEYTAHVYPTKLNEYLAMGIPVVTTDLPEIRRFNAEHGSVVTVAADSEGFLKALREAASRSSAETIESRIDVARQNSWHRRIARMAQYVEEALAARRTAKDSWEQKLRHVYRVTRRRFLGLAVALTLVYVVLFRSTLLWVVAEPLRLAEPARPADAIVVLAGGVGESGKAGEGYQERIKHAVDLYQAGFSPHVIISSGYTYVFKEAEVMKELAIAHGVPAAAILLETKAANTFENASFVERILREHGWRTIVLVSSPYHMRRAVWTFRKVAPEVAVTPVPVPESRFYAHDRGARLEQVFGILHEYLAILAYFWRGWL